MKVIYISSSKIPSKKANSVQVMKMCSTFANEGYEVKLICRGGELEEPPYEYYGVENNFSLKKLWWPKIKLGGVIYGISIARFLRKLSRDQLVYGRCTYGLVPAAKMGFSTVYEAHTPPRNKFHHKLEKELFNSEGFERLVVISSALADEYQKFFPSLLKSKIKIAHDGADLPPENYKGKELKGKKELDIGYVGSLYPGKGIKLIIELANQCKEVDFHILGGNNSIIKKWQERASHLKNLHFYGHIPHQKICSYMKNFDITLAPYEKQVYSDHYKSNNIASWMSPLKIFEYMSFGKPIIASNLPVLREILKDNINALLCDPGEVKSWGLAIEKLKDKQFREKLGRRAKKDYLEKYTWEQRLKKVLQGLK